MIYFAGPICSDASPCGGTALGTIVEIFGIITLIVIVGIILLPFIYRSERKAKKREQDEAEQEVAQTASKASAWQYPNQPTQTIGDQEHNSLQSEARNAKIQ